MSVWVSAEVSKHTVTQSLRLGEDSSLSVGVEVKLVHKRVGGRQAHDKGIVQDDD